MWIERLRASNVRILEELELEPGPGLCVLSGPNGSGKTSILESIHLVALGRSFRSRRRLDVVRRGEESLTVSAVVRDRDEAARRLGVDQGPDGLRLRVDGTPARSTAALARLLPIALVTPESQRMLTDADLRRRLLDWALFHVEPGYGPLHQRYRRALRQRSAALRAGSDLASLESWNAEMGDAGDALHQARARLVDAVLPLIETQIGGLLDRRIRIAYLPGWDPARPLAEVLEEQAPADRERGFGESGPHRADLRFTVEGRAAQHVLSRGEAKLFVAAVVLGQVAHLRSQLGEAPVVLVDDLASELDAESRRRFFESLRQSTAQTLVTTVSADLVEDAGWSHRREFHVEQGELL